MIGSTEPQDDSCTAIGMPNLRGIRESVGCRVILRDIRLIHFTD